jgi:hypothetical protein
MTETNFKALWQQKTPDELNSKEIVVKAKESQRKTRIKLFLGNLLLLVTMLFIIGIVLYFKPKMITTKLGTILVIVAIIMQIVASTNLIFLIKESDSQSNNVEYLKQLLLIKKKQSLMQSKIMLLYFILLGLGLVLYMIEYALRMSLTGAVLTYGITCLWIAINWFYFRPRIIRKQQQNLNDTITAIENMNKQFLEEE